jgi:streptogramin lyase
LAAIVYAAVCGPNVAAAALTHCPAAPGRDASYAPPGAVVVAGEPAEGPGAVTPGCGTRSQLGAPDGIAIGNAGDVYISDGFANTIDKLTPGGRLSIVAGSGGLGAPAPGPARSSTLAQVVGVAADKAGNLYVADPQNDVVEKVTPTGRLSIFAGIVGNGSKRIRTGLAVHTPLGGGLSAVAVGPSGNVYIATVNPAEILRVNRRGEISVFASYGNPGACPSAMAVDEAGSVYLADPCEGDVLKAPASGGTLSVFAGRPGRHGAPTAGPATQSNLATPYGLAVDATGNVYIADGLNGVVEAVSKSGRLSIVLGKRGKLSFQPAALAIDPAGDLYIVDEQDSVVEEVGVGVT